MPISMLSCFRWWGLRKQCSDTKCPKQDICEKAPKSAWRKWYTTQPPWSQFLEEGGEKWAVTLRCSTTCWESTQYKPDNGPNFSPEEDHCSGRSKSPDIGNTSKTTNCSVYFQDRCENWDDSLTLHILADDAHTGAPYRRHQAAIDKWSKIWYHEIL